MRVDYLIIGSGITGATIARILADAGRPVAIVERRDHIGGNVYDDFHRSGIRIHVYGPHYFRTNRDDLWSFVQRFATFYSYKAALKTRVNGSLENWPAAASCIRRLVGERWEPAFRGIPSNFEEASLAMMPRQIYDMFVKPYTEKQWGVPANTLSADLARRFDVREDDEPCLVTHPHQGLPADGYAGLIRNMLADIPVVLNCDYLRHREAFPFRRRLVFTGPIDEYFAYSFGKLKYRGQHRDHEYLPDTDWHQPCGQVNNPDPGNGAHIRTLEWKHMMPCEYAQRIRGTLVTRETPFTPEDPASFEYPYPDEANRRLYQRYRSLAQCDPRVLICGRLGEYKYYDMDQAVDRAIEIAHRLLLD